MLGIGSWARYLGSRLRFRARGKAGMASKIEGGRGRYPNIHSVQRVRKKRTKTVRVRIVGKGKMNEEDGDTGNG